MYCYFLSSNNYICLNKALQALLHMELYVNKSSIDIDLFGKNQKKFFINESLIYTEFNVMEDPINPMTKYKKFYIL